jgi:hypothetical protein
MSTDFSQWNPGAANQETDAAFQADSQRSGGATTGSTWASLLANKILYQVSTLVRALALMLVNKGYSPVDGTSPFQADNSSNAAVTALASVLGNIMTGIDVMQAISISASSGYVRFGTVFDNLVIQWGLTGSLSAGSHAITFEEALSTNNPVVILTPTSSGVTDYWVSAVSLSGFTLNLTGSGALYYIAIGS